MYNHCIKRILDFACALLALIVFSPLFMILIIIGFFAMKGNPFYTQDRPGYKERIFKLIKFRTMTNEIDANGNLLPDEQRLNGYGKLLRSTSLDELPEAINILIGDMSVIGPRPWLVKYLPLYTPEQHRRHDVRPGLSGWAQVNGRNEASWEDRINMDLWYVDHVSLGLHIKIVFMTVLKALKREGISSETSATMEEFKGTKDTAMKEFEGKKLLILGGNPETSALVRVANDMGIKTIVSSARHTDDAKKYAWKAYDVDGMDVPGLIQLAKDEVVDGVLVGVADILVPSYCKVCDALNLPCYATQKIVDVFSFKDTFKKTCEMYGVHGIPEFKLDANMKLEDVAKIQYPIMVKPVDNGGGVGMTVVYDESELKPAVEKALEASKKKRFIVERYMQCDDVGLYYTFKDGICSLSCIFDRYTSSEQPGLSRVNLGSTYPSKFAKEYYEHMHQNAVRMFKEIGIRNGVLLLQAFYENGEFYVYDTGFRLQGEAPHFLIKAINGYDQREMLIRFALTGSEGDMDLLSVDDPMFKGKSAATLWFLLKKGTVKKIEGLDKLDDDSRVVQNIQRIFEGMEVPEEWIGNEKQVLTRLYLVCDSKQELADALREYQNKVKVTDSNGNNMLLKGFDVEKALG